MKRHFWMINRQAYVLLCIIVLSVLTYACSKDNTSLDVYTSEESQGNIDDIISISNYASLGFSHQSAAAYDDYAFFISNGRSKICLFNLIKKEIVFTLHLKGEDGSIYHCNQSTFGVEKYDPLDPFPLLYVSQRSKTDNRCFIEVFRIILVYDEQASDYKSFSIEHVQTILLPSMSRSNSLGNANCSIDAANGFMYTYSRNNNSFDKNYKQCKISKFYIPDIHKSEVRLEDADIIESFMIDTQAVNMQGGCIHDGMLYIGQGYAAAGYIYLNKIDLKRHELVTRYDLKQYEVSWEPEGCFYYDGSIMLAHTIAICRID